MKKIKNIAAIIIIITIVLFNSYSILNNIVYATDDDNTSSETNTSENNNTESQDNTSSGGTTDTPVETESNNDTNNSATSNESNSNSGTGTTTTTTTKKTTTTTTKKTTTSKSNNANLSDLGIRPNDFKGFKPAITSYNVEVENDVTSVEIYAKTQDSRAKATGGGKKSLAEGNNSFNIIVTAENGTKKTYTINITRKASAEATEETTEEVPEEINIETEDENEILGLSKLVIEGVELSPSFKSDVFEYTAKYIGEKTTLNIDTTASKEGSTVEIIGNENLEDGENLINILVTDIEGNIYTYQITLKKSLVDEDAIEENKRKEQTLTAIYIGVAIIIVLIIIIILVSHKMHNKKEPKLEETKIQPDIDEEAEKIAYVNSILQTNLTQKEEEPEPYVQDAWFKKEQMREKQEEKDDYEGPIIYEPEDNYDYNLEEKEIIKDKRKKKRAKGKRFK